MTVENLHDILALLVEKAAFLSDYKYCSEHGEEFKWIISTRFLCSKCNWSNHPAAQRINSHPHETHLQHRFKYIKKNSRTIRDQCRAFLNTAMSVKHEFKVKFINLSGHYGSTTRSTLTPR